MSKNETAIKLSSATVGKILKCDIPVVAGRRSMFDTKKMGMDLRPPMRLNINIGAGFNLLSPEIIIGARGEYIVNGGLPNSFTISGGGNTFKSTLLEFMMLSAMNKIMSTADSFKQKYDTENNISLNELERFTEQFEYLPAGMLLGSNPRWTVTNKATVFAGEWLNSIRKEMMAKAEDKDMQVEFTAFIDYRTGKPLVLPVPIFTDVDSLSELEGEGSVSMIEDKGIDESATMFLQQGGLKTKLLSTLAMLSLKTNTYFGLTAQAGKNSSPETMQDKYTPPPKNSTYISGNTKIKGVSDKFFFLPLLSLFVKKSFPLVHPTTKLPEYPLHSEAEMKTDLHVLDVIPYRNKTGSSGDVLKVVVSQKDGVIPELTDFYNCKENKFGMEGTNLSYSFIIYPDVKMQRGTVRRKLKDDARLARAAEITHELLQSKYTRYVIDNKLWCEPEELYKDLIDLGYDWDVILDTRGWWAPDNYAPYLPNPLSIIDILYMRKGKIPFWYDKSKIKTKELVAA